ncbi:MAG TPA: DUF3488 and transglutaminase-like domain-containing protein [Acidimicrobiales bacterium]|nr:DUF3488 and transglutaminase-like domain-containing protein [Acidimicrobiales bacterium]
MSALNRIREANTRRSTEDSVPLRVAVTVAVVAAATATLRQGVGGSALAVGMLIGIPGAMLFSHLTRYREGFMLKVLLALGILAAFGRFLADVSSLGTGVASDVQIPLAELFLWTQLLHSFDVPARRDLQYSLVSSLVLIGVAGVLSITMSYGLHLVVWAIAASIALVLSHRSELADLPRVVRTGRELPSPSKLLRPVAATLMTVVVLGAVAFSFVPPAGTARALAFPSVLPRASGAIPVPGGLSNPTLGKNDPARRNADGTFDPGGGPGESFGYFGFTESLDTSVRGRPDNTLVMRVRAAQADFWRGQTFDKWNGRHWSLSDDRVREIESDALPLRIPPTPTDSGGWEGSQLVQTYYLERPGPNLIFAAYAADQVYFADRRLFQMTDGTLRAGVELGKDTVYTVISIRPPATAEILREASTGPTEIPRPIATRYLQLPVNMPGRIRELAQEVTAAETNTYDKVRALESWMADNTQYTLDIPRLPKGADAVDQYLFEDRQGFCEQIGSALVVMLRSLGVPARLAVGYSAGVRNPFTGMYEVRASDAHAWAEVWFPGVGWQGFDPTAKVPLAGDAGPQSAAAGLAQYLDLSLPHLPERAGSVVFAIALVGTALGLLAWMAFESTKRRALARRRWVTRFLDRVEAAGRARGRPRPASQSAPAYIRELGRSVLPDGRFDGVAEVVEREVFGAVPAGTEEREQAEQALEEASARWPAG